MSIETQHQLPHSVETAVLAQWVRLDQRGRKELVRFVKQLQLDDEGLPNLAWPAPPPHDSPDYNPVIHGPRSKEELNQMLIDGVNSGRAKDYSIEKTINDGMKRFAARNGQRAT